MAKTKRSKTTRPSAARKKLSSSFEVKVVRLIRGEIKLHLMRGKLPDNPQITMRNDFGTSAEEKMIKADVNCRVESRHTEDNEAAIVIDCTYQVLLSLVSGRFPSDKVMASLSKEIITTSTAAAWPFVRQYCQWVSSQMSLVPLMLRLTPPDLTKIAAGQGKKVRRISHR